MKMCALKTLALGLTVAMMTSTTGVFADHSDRFFFDSLEYFNSSDDKQCSDRRKVEQLTDRVRADFQIVFSNLNTIYAFLGPLSNPNPDTNPAISGILASAGARIIDAEADFLAALAQLGVPQNAIDVIGAQASDFVDFALAYAMDVNLANTGQSTGNQVANAIALENAARALGLSFLALTHDPQFTGILTEIANLTTQDVQAYRLVLADGNIFGATPSNPASETNAAVVINGRIAQLATRLANTLVPRLAYDKCSGDF